MAEVEYRTIDRFLGYRFGTDGSVWCCWRGCSTGAFMTTEWRCLKPRRLQCVPRPTKRGTYVAVRIKPTGEKKAKNYLVHCLILEAFVGPRPEGLEGCHEDGDPANNALNNLRWDTHSANSADMDQHGTKTRGEQKPGAKLTSIMVVDIRKMRSNGMTYQDIANVTGVGRTTIRSVVQGKKWMHVPP